MYTPYNDWDYNTSQTYVKGFIQLWLILSPAKSRMVTWANKFVVTMDITCKYCNSTHVVKFGAYKGIQRYWCKSCKRKFVLNNALPKMKTPARPIASALSFYFDGMPLDAIQRQLQQQYGLYVSESCIYNWITRFSREAVNRINDFKPDTGDKWVVDETVIKVSGKKVWFWDVIDQNSRYLLASKLSNTGSAKDAALVMKEAQKAAGKTPKWIITVRLTAYTDGIEIVFSANTKHVQSKPFIDKDATNVIERFHGMMQDRTNAVRSIKNKENANLLTDAWLVHYNFFKQHKALSNIPPAQKMKKPVPFKGWEDVLRLVKDDLVKSISSSI